MTDEVFNLMKNFTGSYINRFGEVIISDKGNVYFNAKNCNSKMDFACKLLEFCSRSIHKGVAYAQKKRNHEWQEKMLNGLNEYLGTQFTLEDMCLIYDELGNAVNHDLTLKFIESGYDLTILKP